MEYFLGSLLLVPYNFAPAGWALCQGQLLPIAQYTALFSLLGTTYGGDGVNTFALPDLRGRVPISSGQGVGLQNYNLGQTGGAESATLGVNQLPSHNHSVNTVSSPATASQASNQFLASSTQGSIYSAAEPTTRLHAMAINHTGGGQPVNIRSPYLTLNWIIALTGIFPSQS
jgi:microcystin-dependent protein